MGLNENYCAYLSRDWTIHTTILGHYTKVDLGWLNVCLCTQDISTFITQNSIAEACVEYKDATSCENDLYSFITNNGWKKKCVYPLHGISHCMKNNVCAFQCKDGFTAWPADWPIKCKCKSPKHLCNGVCTTASCPSAGWGGGWKRYADPESGFDEQGLAKREPRRAKGMGGAMKATCPEGFTTCGVYGGRSTNWECINTQYDLESCGGCSIPLLGNAPSGQDCSAIPNVGGVTCSAGKCVVQSCEKGYHLSANASACEQDRVQNDTDDGNGEEMGMVQLAGGTMLKYGMLPPFKGSEL